MKKNNELKKYTKEEYELLENQLKKVLADYSNLEKDIEKRTQIILIQQKISLGRHLLESLDSFELALKASESIEISENIKSWFDGIIASISKLQKLLLELDIVKIEVNKGDNYDSSLHEAVGMVVGGVKGTICDIMQSGYIVGEFVVRPARVIVYQGENK